VHDGVDVLDPEERIEDAMRLIELDEPPIRQHPLHLRCELPPLLRAVEVLEDGKAAFEEVGAERRGF
jgi:hypothetical protein